MNPESKPRTRVMVIGAGWHMTSGISHYTYRLSTALAEQSHGRGLAVSTLLMRRLIPKRAYPGAARVGADVTDASYPDQIPVYDGVDWYWGPSMRGALAFMDRQRPEVVILQWWTGAVLHSYLRLASYAARHGARVIVEWHESQDVGEAGLPGARAYVTSLMPRLLARSAAHVVHSDYDLQAISAAYPLGTAPVRVIKHGPYDHLARPRLAVPAPRSGSGPLRLLYLGLVRPFKGVEDLVEAFSGLDRADAERFRLTIVGETWEGWTAPALAIARSPHADLIERVDRYVTDTELSAYFATADAVVLPYHRSSASGPLQIAMSAGLPVVVTSVGGLVEAVRDYPGALLVPPRDPAALRGALLALPSLRGRRYADPHSWDSVASEFTTLFATCLMAKPAVLSGTRQTDISRGDDPPYPACAGGPMAKTAIVSDPQHTGISRGDDPPYPACAGGPMAKTAIVSDPQHTGISRGDDPPYPPMSASGGRGAEGLVQRVARLSGVQARTKAAAATEGAGA